MTSPLSSSSSSPDLTCFHCHISTNMFRKGWELRNGGSAMLCDKCGSAYEEGRFCVTFHLSASGWRDCSSCKKRIHCGCIASKNNYTKMDFGDVKCLDCSKYDDAVEERRRALSMISEANRVVKETLQVNFSPATFNHQSNGPLQTKETGTSSSAYVEPFLVKSRLLSFLKLSDGTSSCSHHLNDMNKLQQPSFKTSLSSSVRVFEKLLSSKDADPKKGCLSLPKKCVERYFPKLSQGEMVPVVVQDKSGVYWEFFFCVRLKRKHVAYSLEGMGNFLSLMQCKCGDRVILHRLESSGEFVIEVEKSRN